MTFLELLNVTKRFGAQAVVNDVTLSIPTGSRTAIVGPSGSGKTTLLRLIAGFEIPDTGSIRLDGNDLTGRDNPVPAYRRGIGIVAQDGALFPHLTIAENIGFGLQRTDPLRQDRIAELIDLVELDRTMLHRKPDELSGGQQQRVALARALARKPKLMLLDEPFSALDTGLRISTRKVVADLLSAAGITTILVTHDQAEALSFADQVAVMRQGRLEQSGTPRELYFRPRNSAVAELLGDAIILEADIADGWADCNLGRMRVNDSDRRGPAEIMVRPEQITIEPVQAGSDALTTCQGTAFGRIRGSDFAGPICTLTIDLLDLADTRHGSAAPLSRKVTSITLPATGYAAPAIGSIVSISVHDAVHVLGLAPVLI